jgi:hypothetical protein
MHRVLSSLIIGLILIVIGAGLMANQFLPFEFGWSQIYPLLFLALALSAFIKAFSGQHSSAFGGGFFGALGLFFAARNFGFIDSLWFFEWWPIIFLAMGVGFICSFLFRPTDWGVLVPAFIFTGLGSLFLLNSLGVVEDIFETAWDLIDRYWPLALVLIGVAFILISLRPRTEHAGNNSPKRTL